MRRPAAVMAVLRRPAAADAAPPPQIAAAPAALEPIWMVAEDPDARQYVFLVTMAALLNDRLPAGRVARANPSTMSRNQILAAMLDAIANPTVDPAAQRRGGRPRTGAIVALKVLVGREPHETRPGEYHFHVAVKVSGAARWQPYKQALLQRSGLASHWSTTHTMLWSTFRYIIVPSAKRPTVDANPLQWTHDGARMDLYEESQEPYTADACKRRREQTEMEVEAGCGGKKQRFTKLDFTSVVLSRNLDTKAKVLAYVQTKGSKGMQVFVNNNQHRLKEMIRHTREWGSAHTAAAAEAESDIALIQRLADGTCQCGVSGCVWWAAADAFLKRNRATIDRQYLASAMRRVIEHGPSKTTRVPLLAGPRNAGKSTMTDPILEVFGEDYVLTKPKLGAGCPLSNLTRGPRFIYFDDYRPVEFAALPRDNPTVSVTTFLALFQGQPFDVQVSQSFNDGHPKLRWTRGAAMTAKLDGFWSRMGNVADEDIRHMQARVLQFDALVTMREEDFVTVPRCKES